MLQLTQWLPLEQLFYLRSSIKYSQPSYTPQKGMTEVPGLELSKTYVAMQRL